jgi:hypothetical protein
MIARIFLGAGLFVFGYFVGREIGRTEAVRDQLRRAADDDRMPTELQSGRQAPTAQVSPRPRPTSD